MSGFEVRTPRTQITAPADHVWDILTDVERYGEWNPFTPQARTDFRIGTPAHLLVRMGSTRMRITEIVCAFEPTRLIAWKKAFGPSWLLLAVREQRLEPVNEGNCAYHNTDRLTGILAPIVFLCFGRYMRRGFNDVGKGLKRFAESTFARAESEGGAG